MSNVKFIDSPGAASQMQAESLRVQLSRQGRSINRLNGRIRLLNAMVVWSVAVNVALIAILIFKP